MFCLNGKVAFVTGAAQGIGRISAEKLAELGAQVALADLNLEKAQAAAEDICQAGGKAIAVALNVGDNDSIEAAVAKTAEAFGGIDIVVNCAGILGTKSIEEMPREGEWKPRAGHRPFGHVLRVPEGPALSEEERGGPDYQHLLPLRPERRL